MKKETLYNDRFSLYMGKMSEEEFIKSSKELSNINLEIEKLKKMLPTSNSNGQQEQVAWLKRRIAELEEKRNTLRTKIGNMSDNKAVNENNIIEFTMVNANIKSQSTKVGKSKNDIANYIIANVGKEYIFSPKAVLNRQSGDATKKIWNDIPAEVQELLAAISNCVARDEIGVFNTFTLALIKDTEYKTSAQYIPVGIINLSKRIRLEYGISKLYIRIDRIKYIKAYALRGLDWDTSAFVTSIK